MSASTARTNSTTSKQSHSEQLISMRIAEACKALWWAEIVRRVLGLIIVSMLVLLAWLVLDQWVYASGVLLRSLIWLVMIAGATWYVVRRIVPVLRHSIRPEYAARSLERDMPDMRQELTSYITLQPDAKTSNLRSRVVRSIGSLAAGRLRSHDALPSEATGTMRWWIAAAITLAMLAGYAVMSPKNSAASVGRIIAPLANIEPSRRVSIEDVKPGDIETIAGRTVSISADVHGLRSEEPVVCRWQTASRENEFELVLGEGSNRYQGDLTLDHSASGRISYTVHAGDDTEGPFWMSVQNVPVVIVQSVHYEPPAYTGEAPHTSGSAAISAVDGTKVTIRARTNRPITKARIEFNPKPSGDTTRATAGMQGMAIADDGMGLSISLPLRTVKGGSSSVQFDSYRLRVWDEAEQGNPDPIVYPIRIISDLPPDVAIVLPRKSPKAMGINLQQTIEVHAMDPDFGLKQVELKVQRGNDVVSQPILWSDKSGAKGNKVTEYRFRPTEHGLRVGDVVQIVAIATDNRSSDDDVRIAPNVSVTDAIELRIVDEEPAPDSQGADDGLSQTDQKPASDHDPQDQQPTAGKKDSQDNGGGKSSQEGGQKQKGGGGSGQGDSGKTQQGDPDSQGSESGGSQQSDDPSKMNDSSKQSGSGQSSEGQPDQGNPNQGQSETGQPNQGQPNQGQPNQGQPNQGQPSEGQPSEGQPSADGQSQGGSQNEPGGQGDTNQAAPKHPGEAFERIRDYIERKKNEEQSGDSSRGDDSQVDPAKQPDAKNQSNPDNQGSENRGNKAAGKDAGDKQDPSNSTGGTDQQNGESGGQKPEGDTNSPESGDQSAGKPGSQPDEGQPDEGQPDEGQPSSSGGRADQEQNGDSKTGSQQGTEEQSGTGSARQPNEQTGQPDQQSGSGDSMKDSNQGQPNQEAGDQNASGQSPGDQKSGGQGDRNQEAGDQNTGEQNTGEQNAGEQSMGDQNSGGQKAGEQESGSQEPGSQDSGGQKAGGQSPSGDSPKQTGDQPNKSSQGDESKGGNSGQSGTGQSGKGAGDQKASENSQSQDQPGQKPNGKPGEKSGNQPSQQGQPGEQSGERPGEQSGQQASDQTGQPGSSQQNSGEKFKPSQQPSTNSQSGSATGDGNANGSGDMGDAAPPPAAADMEYTKKATDMVLDYLKETRDAPDRELLDELNWSEDDLKRFADRWQKTREMKPGQPGQTNKDLQEALNSLGMRPSGKANGTNIRDSADNMRSIRDSGNRKPAPAAYRDVFEAYRRGLGRKQ